jgi:hypothetical protein
MADTSPKLLGAVIRLDMREAGSWKASGGASGAGGGGVFEARNAAEAELQKLLSSKLDQQIIHGDIFAAFLAGIDALFKSLCDQVTVAAVSPATLADSAMRR